MITDIPIGKYASFYKGYIELVSNDLDGALTTQTQQYNDFIIENKERLEFRYDADKWSIRQVMIHVIDTEHVFAYRLLRIARGDKTPMAGFDQNVFIDNNDFTHLTETDLVDMWTARRADTIKMIKGLDYNNYIREGEASGYEVSAGAILYMIAGHAQHHYNILLERYM